MKRRFRSINLSKGYKWLQNVKCEGFAGWAREVLLSPRAQRDTNVCTCPVPFASLVSGNISVSQHRMGSTCTTKEQKERIGAEATFDFSRVISALSLEVPRHPLASRLHSRLEDPIPRPRRREEATESVPERYRRDFP